MQEIQLIGNLGRDAEVKESNGNKFATFSIGCTTRRKNGEEVKEVTSWYDCTTDNMRIVDFLRKGTKVFVRGSIKLDQYHSDTLNKWIPIIRVYVQSLELLSPKKEDSSNASPPVAPIPTEAGGNEGSDLPF